MAEKMNKKRERGANYTSEEKALLIDLIMQYKHIIEDKRTGGLIFNKKKEAWKEITSKYNSNCTTGCRQSEQLKALYDNIKQKTRKSVGENNKKEYIQIQNGQMDVTECDLSRALKNVRDDKVQMHKTGGGFWRPKTTESDTKVLALIQDIAPLANPYDSGAVYFKDNHSYNIEAEIESGTMEVDVQLPDVEITPAYNNITELGNIETIPTIPTANNYGDLCVSSPSILSCSAPMMAINTPVVVPVQDHSQQSERKILPNTPSRKMNIAPKKLKNRVASAQKVHKSKSAEALKRIYFKRKADNAYLERKKLLNEILQQKKEHDLEMLILKKQLDNLNKC